ncbi:MAG: glycosyltransferase family 1 protein [Verrucomicrobiota bacterium]
MRFTIITDTYPPEVNGVAMTLNRLADGLVQLGHDVEVVHPKRDGESDSISGSGVRSFLVPGFPVPKYPELRMGFPQGLQLAARWKEARPDAIYVATEGLLGNSAVGAARSMKIPIVSGYHTNFAQYMGCYRVPMLEKITMHYLKAMHNRTFCTMAPTEEMAGELRAEGFENVKVMGRGVDANLFSPDKRDESLRGKWGAGPDDVVAICVGRIAPEKNLPLAIDAFLAERKGSPGMKFVLVGSGPEEEELAERYGDDVIWAGVQRGEDLARHYASADLFLFPSLTETYGNVLVEAMASGLVALGFRYAAAEMHVFDGENGFTVDCDNVDGFAPKLREVLAMRASWPEIQAAARAKATELSWEAVFRRFEEQLTLAAASVELEPPELAAA